MSHCRRGRVEGCSRARATVGPCVLVILLISLLSWTTADPADAKTPGKTYCYFGKCHTVKTIAETQRLIGSTVTLSASHYDDPARDRYNPSRITSSGEYFRSDRPDNAASPIYPDGTRLLLWNPATRQSAVVRINNAGPYWGSRNLDVSKATADRLGFAKQGVATLKGKVLSAPTVTEATYRKGRTYPPVPGHIGVFETIDTALLSVGRAMNNIFTTPVHAAAGREELPRAAPVLVASAVTEQTPSMNASKVAAKIVPMPVAKSAAPVRVAAKRPAKARPVAVASVRTKAAMRVASARLRAVVPSWRVASSDRQERSSRVDLMSRENGAMETRRLRLADADARESREYRDSRDSREYRSVQSNASARCRAGSVAMRSRDGGRQARVVCVSSAPEVGSRSSRSPERLASLRNRS